jgi:hypothetical protein
MVYFLQQEKKYTSKTPLLIGYSQRGDEVWSFVFNPEEVSVIGALGELEHQGKEGLLDTGSTCKVSSILVASLF